MDFGDIRAPVDGRETESMVLAQDTPYWHFYKAWKRYDLTIFLFEGALFMPPTSLLSGGIDPYVVVSVAGRREATKRKTPVVRRTTHPVFNTAMHFKGVKFTDQIRIELKVNRNLAENILLFQTFLRMDELLKLIAPHPVETKFEITLQDARAEEGGSRDPRDSPSAALLCCFDLDPKVPPDLPDSDAFSESAGPRSRTPGFSLSQLSGSQFSYSKRLSVGSVGTEGSEDYEEDSNAFDPAFLSVRRDFACLMVDSDITVSNEPSIERPSHASSRN